VANRRDRRREKFGPPASTAIVPATQRALSLVPPASGQPDSRVPVGIGLPPPTITRWIPTTFGELDWPTVDAMLRLAQRGLTLNYTDLTRRMLATDGHILSCYGTRITPVAGAQYTIKPPTGVSPERRAMAELAAADCTAAMSGLQPETLFKHMLDGIFTGWSVSEIIWTVRNGMVWPSDLILHNPRRFQFADDFSLYVYDQGWAASEAKYNSAVNALGPPLERDKFIIHVPRELPDEIPVSGLFHALVRAWWAKSWLLKYWLSGAENAGNPRLVGTLTQNADHATRNSFATAINALSADAQCILNEGASLEYLDGSQNVGTVWEAQCAYWDATITKAVLGSTLNVEIGSTGGNRAAAESQDAATILPRLEGDQRQMWKTIERCLFEPFLRFNLHRYGGVMPDVPVGASEIVRQKPEVDDLTVDQGAVTYDELRSSRGLEPWGPQAGGEVRIPRKVEGFAPTLPQALPVADAMQTAAPTEDVAATALNGAQVTALQGLLASVATGELAPEAAIIAIVSAFPTIAEPQVRRMVMAQAGLPPPPEASAEPGTSHSGAPSPLGGAGSVDTSTPRGASAGGPFRMTAGRLMPWQVALRAALESSQRKPTT
jgi:hypothetical protein